MTTQTIHLQTFDYGSSLTSATLRALTTDNLVATADSANEVTADGGLYAIVFDETSVIAAGTYRLRAVVSGLPIQRYVTLAGTDGEIVQASLVPAVTLATSQPNYAPLTTLGTNAPANWINAAAIAADSIGASQIAASAVSELQNGLMLAASYTAPDNAGIAAIQARTDNLPSDPADQSLLEAAITAAQTAIINQGNTAWATATGFSTHSAADVWAVGTRTITGGTVTTVSDKTGYSLATTPPTAAAIADAVWDESRTGHTTNGTFGYYVDAQISGISGGGGGTVVIDTAGVNAIVNALLAQGPTLYNALTTTETTLRIGDEYVQQFRDLGNISTRDDIAFALKTRKTDTDASALIYITENGGLTRVNGAAYATTADGSITVDDATNGHITVRISSAVTASLTVGKRQDAVKILITDGNDITKRQGLTNVIDGVVDARA